MNREIIDYKLVMERSQPNFNSKVNQLSADGYVFLENSRLTIEGGSLFREMVKYKPIEPVEWMGVSGTYFEEALIYNSTKDE